MKIKSDDLNLKLLLAAGLILFALILPNNPIYAQTEIKLLASDGTSGDQFGYSVAVSGDVAIVGAQVKNWGSGAAYLFKRDESNQSNWNEFKKLIASDHFYQDRFRASVALS